MARFQRHHRFVSLVLAASMAVGLVACGGSSGSSNPGAKTNLTTMKCVPNPKSGLGKGDVCVDSGLRNSSFFSFANWGGRRYKADSFGFNELIALYGDKVVCTKVRSSICRITPKARLIRETIDNILQNGRCEGLSTLGALYMQSKGPDPKKFGVDGVQSLSPSIDEFGDVIDYWWATQFLQGAADSSKNSRKSGVESVLKTIVDGIANKRGTTVGLYSSHGAHSVLPVAVTREGENKYIVHVWDSNNPRVLGRILFDLAKKQWTFAGGRLNSGSSSAVWSGGDGSIDAVTMESRSGKPIMNISSGQKGNATVSASTSSSRELSLTVATKDGQKLVASSTGVTGAIPGVSATPLRNGDTTQIVVSIPNDLEAYSLKLSANSDVNTAAGNTQLTIADDGARAVSLAIPSTSVDISASMAITATDGNLQTISTVSPQKSVMTAATDGNLVNVPLAQNESAVLADSATGAIDSVLTLDPADAKPQSVEISKPEDGIEQNVVVMRSSTGDLVALKSTLAPVQINQTTIDNLSSISAATSQSSGSTGIAALPANVADTDVVNFVDTTQDTSAVIKTRVNSTVPSEIWIEYGPSSNWNSVSKSSTKSVAAGVDVETKTSLSTLTPGTSYRYRTAVRIDEHVVYSAYSTFETTGEAIEDSFTDVSDANVIVKSKVVATTATGSVITSSVTTPVASKLWVEYALAANTSQIMKTEAQSIGKGTAIDVASVVNGLTLGQLYKYRVVVQARTANGYSVADTFTTGSNASLGVIPVTALGAVFSAITQNVSTNSLEVLATISSPVAGRVQVEIRRNGSSESVLSKAQNFEIGSRIKVVVAVGALEPNTNYMVRAVVRTGKVTQYSPFQNVTTVALVEGDTSDGRIEVPSVIAAKLTTTSATLVTTVKSGNAGTVVYEYGVDNASAVLYTSRAFIVAEAGGTVADYQTDVSLRAGTPYRARAVLTIGDKKYSTLFVKFTTAGSMDYANYKASVPTPIRTAAGADLSWSLPVVDVPSAFTFKVLEGSNALCTVSAGTTGCSVAISTFGTHSLVIATFYNGTEVTRSNAFSVQIGGTPTISAFTFVSATSSSLTFTYSFSPQGETVQYGIEIRTAQDQFVKADLGGSTSSAVNGATHLVSGLTATTSYKARLILMYGSNVVSGTWVNISTT